MQWLDARFDPDSFEPLAALPRRDGADDLAIGDGTSVRLYAGRGRDAEIAVTAPNDPAHIAAYYGAPGRVYVFQDPIAFSWDTFDPPLDPPP